MLQEKKNFLFPVNTTVLSKHLVSIKKTTFSTSGHEPTILITGLVLKGHPKVRCKFLAKWVWTHRNHAAPHISQISLNHGTRTTRLDCEGRLGGDLPKFQLDHCLHTLTSQSTDKALLEIQVFCFLAASIGGSRRSWLTSRCYLIGYCRFSCCVSSPTFLTNHSTEKSEDSACSSWAKTKWQSTDLTCTLQ